MRSSAGNWSALYFIFWIFIGNFVLLNLFLAILLQSFSADGEAESDNQLENVGGSGGNVEGAIKKLSQM
jgi:hypothetical protein